LVSSLLDGFCEVHFCNAVKYKRVTSLPVPSSYPDKHHYFAFAELYVLILAHNNRRQLRSTCIISFASVPEAARTRVFSFVRVSVSCNLLSEVFN
jgi:hypothetical protein